MADDKAKKPDEEDKDKAEGAEAEAAEGQAGGKKKLGKKMIMIMAGGAVLVLAPWRGRLFHFRISPPKRRPPRRRQSSMKRTSRFISRSATCW